MAALCAVATVLGVHTAVTWAVYGSIDRVVFAVDAAFALLGLLAASFHLQQLGRERRRQRLVQALARTLSSPRDVADTALAAGTLLMEAGVADAVVVGVAHLQAESSSSDADAIDVEGGLLAPLARVGFPDGVHDDRELALASFARTSVAREMAAADAWLQSLHDSLGARPVVARVPLRRGEEQLGALLLVARDAGPLTDPALLASAATMIATALDNAFLYQATLEQARDLEAQDARRREFLYAISHELRTPLTSIRAFSELLIEERVLRRGRRAAPSPEEEELLNSLARGVDRLSDLVEDLLQLGRSEEIEAHVELTAIDASVPLRAAESIIRPSFMRRAQTLQTALPTEPVWVYAESRVLEQVLINLLSNANRHSPEGGLITASLVAVEGVARFEVSDSGPGVPAAERSSIFEPFYRVRQAGTQVPGSGLGLAIARRGVEQLSGRIWVEDGDSADPSAPGARFCVEVPLAPAELVPPSEPRSRPAPQALQEAVDDATQLQLELHQRE